MHIKFTLVATTFAVVFQISCGLQCRCFNSHLDKGASSCLPHNNTCVIEGPAERGVCYSAVVYDDIFDQSVYSKGCLIIKDTYNDWLVGVKYPMRCYNTDKARAYALRECCRTHLCNDELEVSLFPQITTTETSHNDDDIESSSSEWKIEHLLITILAPTALLCILGIIIFVVWNKRRINRHSSLMSYDTERDPMIPNGGAVSSTSLQQFLNDFSHSGSGAGGGLPLMMQITIARQIQLEETIGVGRFGDVKRGKWRGDNVAVKIFHSWEEASWFREAEIYQTAMLRHDNILGFIAADNIDNGMSTQLLLVTEYHERGSLYDFLIITELSMADMLKICHSIACGLSHLHMEIVGKQGKPAIAHRDLKSKNILVKRDGVTCCIADMGLAVKHDSSTDTINLPTMNDRVGTNRYMAPEVISEDINMQHFDSFKQGDIYSLALVYWEIARRVNIGGKCDEYQLPYFDLVPSDPTIENMRAVVCDRKQRPAISNKYHDIQCLKNVCKMIKECWHEKPAARLTALRIKKTLAGLAQQEKVSLDV